QQNQTPQIGIFFGGAAETLLKPWSIGQLYKDYDGNEKDFFTPGVPANFLSVTLAHNVVCSWSCKHRAACEGWDVDIFGYSRGAILAVELANRLNFEGCDCNDDGNADILPVNIRFMGLIDPVEFALFGLPVRHPYVAPPNIRWAIQHGCDPPDAPVF
nr:hypothetical protein [Pirellula sp.]